MVPSAQISFEAKAGSAEEHLSWSTMKVNERPSDDWKRLDALMRMIDLMVDRKPEWKRLPKPRGGYY
jgi:hypothetical protein